MLTFPENYFEDETRCDFHITGMMKRFWAAQMEVLSCVDSICSKYDIPYILIYGSLMGAVRHKGYIPWDDDIDIAMLRPDYNRFVEIISDELPPYLTTKSLLPGAIPPKELIFGISSGTRLNTGDEHLKLFHGCPYAITIDLFVFDKVSEDPEESAYQDRLLRLLDRFLEIQWSYDKGTMNSEMSSEYASTKRCIESELDFTFTDSEPMTIQILKIMDLACGLCNDCDSKHVEHREQSLHYGYYGYREDFFTDRIRVPFEGVLSLPISRDYDTLLRLMYGDYTVFRKFAAAHDYPSYKLQREVLYREYRKRNWDIPNEFLEYDENGHLVVDPYSV